MAGEGNQSETVQRLGRTREQRRRRGRGAKTRKVVAAPAFITRQIPYFEYLNEEGLVRLEEQADWLMQEVGLEFRDDPKALRIWKEAGADVKGTRVRLPKGMARELCKTAPAKFKQHSRNPQQKLSKLAEQAPYSPRSMALHLSVILKAVVATARWKIWKNW